jgi:hypothetical protein
MATRLEVEAFLAEFHQKMKIWDIRIRDDRGKNTQALLDLELSPAQRIKIIEALKTDDYSEGPNTDVLNAGAPLWVFGVAVKKRDIYIKISVGQSGSGVICISFHPSEHPMKFPLKENKL